MNPLSKKFRDKYNWYGKIPTESWFIPTNNDWSWWNVMDRQTEWNTRRVIKIDICKFSFRFPFPSIVRQYAVVLGIFYLLLVFIIWGLT